MKPKINFEVGDIISNVEILKIEKHLDAYTIKYGCCGKIYVVQKKSLLNRKNLRSKKCRTCSANDRNGTSYTEIDKPQVRQIYIDGWGMTLGPMGFRYR